MLRARQDACRCLETARILLNFVWSALMRCMLWVHDSTISFSISKHFVVGLYAIFQIDTHVRVR